MKIQALVVAVASLLALMPQALAEIPSGPDAPLGAEFRAELLEDVLSRTVEVYKRITPRDDPHREEAIEFLTGVAHWLAGSHERPDMNILLDQGDQLVEAGCADGLVHWATGYLIDLHNHWKSADHYWHEAFQKVVRSGSPYSFRTRAHALSVMAGWTYHNDGAEASRAPWKLVAHLLEEALKREESGELSGRMLHAAIAPMFRTAAPTDILQTMSKSVAEHVSDEWARESILGAAHFAMAWSVRGHGTADTVTPEGWRGFRKHLLFAQGHLLRAHALAPDRPEAATHLIGVSRAGLPPTGSTARDWFDRAVQAEFDYLPAYEQFATTLSLRWGGSEAKLDAFANECIETGRFDTRVPFMALEAYAWMERDLTPEATWSDARRYDTARRLFRRSAEEAPEDQRAAPRTAMLIIASHVGDWALVDRLETDLNEHFDHYVRWKFQADYPAILEGLARYRERKNNN